MIGVKNITLGFLKKPLAQIPRAGRRLLLKSLTLGKRKTRKIDTHNDILIIMGNIILWIYMFCLIQAFQASGLLA